MRGTTLIYSAIARRTFRTSKKARRCNGRSRHSLLGARLSVCRSQMYSETSRRTSHQLVAFCMPYRLILLLVKAFLFTDSIIAYIFCFVNTFLNKKWEGHALPPNFIALSEG